MSVSRRGWGPISRKGRAREKLVQGSAMLETSTAREQPCPHLPSAPTLRQGPSPGRALPFLPALAAHWP